MKLLETTALGIRLMSIYCFLKSIGVLVVYISELMSRSEGSDYPASTLFLCGASFILFTVATLACAKFSTLIATWLLPKINDQSPILNDDLETIQLAAFTIIGAFLLAFSLPELASNFIAAYLRSNHNYDNPIGNNSLRALYWAYSQVFVDLIQISIGAYMLLGASGLIGIIKKLRTAGSKP